VQEILVFIKRLTSLCFQKISEEFLSLIREMARDNRLWGAERTCGELLKLGIRVCLPHYSEIHETGVHNSTT
jgi:hypothetical protein